MKQVFALVLAVFAFAYAQVSWSQTPSPGVGWQQGISQTGQKVWFGPGTLSKSSASMGQAVWDSAMSGGGAKFNLPAKLAVNAGVVDVVAKAVVTGPNIFAGFRAATGGPLGIALLAAPAIIDWLNQGGVRPASSGATHGKPFEIKDSQACSVGPCYEYSADLSKTWHSSATSACLAAKPKDELNPPRTYVFKSSTGSYCTFTYTDPYNPGTVNIELRSRSVAPSPDSWLPASMDDIAPYMTDRAASAAAIQAMLDHNAQFKFTSPSVTGPASVSALPAKKETPVPAPPPTTSGSTTSGNPHGLSDNTPTVTSSGTGSRDVTIDGKTVSIPTKTTTTSTYNPTTNKTTSETTTTSDPHTVTTTTTPKSDITYSTGPNAKGETVSTVTSNTVNNTVTNITNNVTNQTTTTTSTESKPETPSTPSEEKEKEDYTFTDSELGEIPELYKRKYEDGIKGVWDEKLTAIKATPLFSLGRDIMPSLATSGTCPTFTVPLDLAGWASYGTADVSPPCWVWDFGKVVIVVSSLLLARRLIFGG